jgi:hypothetical protein
MVLYCHSNLDDLSRRLVAIMQKDEAREAALLSPSRATSRMYHLLTHISHQC